MFRDPFTRFTAWVIGIGLACVGWGITVWDDDPAIAEIGLVIVGTMVFVVWLRRIRNDRQG